MYRSAGFGFVCAFVMMWSLPALGGIINFGGQFTSGTGSLLGDLPPQRSFNVQLDFDSSLPGIGTVNSGMLTFSALSLNITGGNIFVSESGAMDQATLLFNTSGPNGSLSVSFFGNAIADSMVNESNLNALIRVGAPAAITANFGSSGSYTGTITAVPEPTSFALATIGIAIMGLGYRMRRSGKTMRVVLNGTASFSESKGA